LVDLAVDDTPLDPRVRQQALDIVRGVPEGATDERARRVYRWVLDHVQDGKESDGRRVVIGRSGSRQAAFRYLLSLLGISTELAVVRDRLAAPPLGKMSEVEVFDALLIRFDTDKGPRWLQVRDKFAPYGWVPAEMRGAPAYRLTAGTPAASVDAPGALDSAIYEGRADLKEDGSASLDLVVSLTGGRAIGWRNALDQVPDSRLYDFVEKELISSSFDGGHVRDLSIDGKADLDAPLVIKVRIQIPSLAKPVAQGLALEPILAVHLGQLAGLPERHTPLLRRASLHAEVRVRVVMPEALRMPADLTKGEVSFGDARVSVKDAVNGHAIDFDRVIDLPAARVQPGDEYTRYQRFARDADALVTREVLIGH
jgi:hypothetical protein